MEDDAAAGTRSAPPARTDGPIRVVVASDFYLQRAGVTTLLTGHAALDVLPSEQVRALEQRLATDPPDVVLLMLAPGLRSAPQVVSVARMIKETAPDVGLLVIAPLSDSLVRALVENGPRGVAFLLDDRITDVHTVVRVIEDIVDGVVAVHAEVSDVWAGREENRGLADLTRREFEVLAELSRGLSNSGIAAALHLSVKAVEGNLTSIFRKLGLNSDNAIDRRTTAVLTFLNAHP